MPTDGQTEGRADRWTDMTKLIVTFRNFANAPKNADRFVPTRSLSQYGLQRSDEMKWDAGVIIKNKYDYFEKRRKQYRDIFSLALNILNYILLFLFACWNAEF